MTIRRNKSGVVIVHEGTYVLSATDHTAICRGENTSAITTAAGQQVFAAAAGSIAVAEAAGSRAYATAAGAFARAYGKGTTSIAMAYDTKAYSKRGGRAVATILGAGAFKLDAYSTAEEDLIQLVYPSQRAELRLNVT